MYALRMSRWTFGSVAALFLAVLIGVIPRAALAQGAEKGESRLMQVEQQWLAALRKHDNAALDCILARDWIDNSSSGRVLTRADVLGRPPGAVPSSKRKVTQHFDGTRVRIYGDVGVVTGRVVTQITDLPNGETQMRQTLFTDVLLWREGRWQAVSSQETVIPEAAVPPPANIGM
jgi:hypothetical protein